MSLYIFEKCSHVEWFCKMRMFIIVEYRNELTHTLRFEFEVLLYAFAILVIVESSKMSLMTSSPIDKLQITSSFSFMPFELTNPLIT